MAPKRPPLFVPASGEKRREWLRRAMQLQGQQLCGNRPGCRACEFLWREFLASR